jgi:Ca2+-binding RTX toxin-like protein
MATTNTLTGSSQADILNAPGSSVTLVEGLGGNDTITLALINDEANGGLGNDSIAHSPSSGASNVLIEGGAGNDTLYVRSASSFGGVVTMGDGADSVAIGSNSNVLISSAFVRGGTGNDTLVIGNTLSASTIGGGSGADLLTFTFGNTITSSEINGGQQKDSIDFRNTGTMVSSSVNGGRGNDTIVVGTGFISTSALIGGGKGQDSISVASAAHTNTSISGGAHADSITIVSQLSAITTIYGDTVGSTTTSTDAAGDFIKGTAGISTTASSIYGGGGNDTIFLLGFNQSQSLISGGDGADSIRIASSSNHGKITGGAGNDTITIKQSSDSTLAAPAALVTVDGGAGTDMIRVGTNLDIVSALATVTALNMVVAYGAGDVIDLGTTLATTQSNWAAGGVYNLSAAAAITAVATVAGSLDGIGDVGVWSDGTDSFLAVQTLATSTQSSLFVIKIDGKDLTNKTLFGTQALKAANFGFDVDYSASAGGLKITLT